MGHLPTRQVSPCHHGAVVHLGHALVLLSKVEDGLITGIRQVERRLRYRHRLVSLQQQLGHALARSLLQHERISNATNEASVQATAPNGKVTKMCRARKPRRCSRVRKHTRPRFSEDAIADCVANHAFSDIEGQVDLLGQITRGDDAVQGYRLGYVEAQQHVQVGRVRWRPFQRDDLVLRSLCKEPEGLGGGSKLVANLAESAALAGVVIMTRLGEGRG